MLILPSMGLSKEPQQARSRAMVDAVIQAARQLFMRDGYLVTSTVRIAERAGMSVGSLYQYFPTKDAILTELARRAMQQNLARFETALEAALAMPMERGVRCVVHELLGCASTTPHALRREVLSHLPPPAQRADTRLHERYLHSAKRFLRAYASGSAEPRLAMGGLTIVASLVGILDATARSERELVADPDFARHVSASMIANVRATVKVRK